MTVLIGMLHDKCFIHNLHWLKVLTYLCVSRKYTCSTMYWKHNYNIQRKQIWSNTRNADRIRSEKNILCRLIKLKIVTRHSVKTTLLTKKSPKG